MFNRVSLIITIICFSYSVIGLIVLLVFKIYDKIKAKRVIRETAESVSHIEVIHYDEK